MGELFERPGGKVDAFCLSLAKSLFAAVKSCRKLRVKPRPDRVVPWGRLFEKWVTGENEQVVERVVDWYCKNVNQPSCPQAYSAQAFKDKFEQIKRRMEAETDEVEEIELRNILLASRLVDELGFPVEIRTRLPVIVQRTRQNWEKFCQKMQSKVSRSAGDRKCAFLESILKSSAAFVETWMAFLSQKYGWLPHYTGSALDLAFRPDHVLFKDSFWRAWSADYCADARAFDELLVELNRKE